MAKQKTVRVSLDVNSETHARISKLAAAWDTTYSGVLMRGLRLIDATTSAGGEGKRLAYTTDGKTVDSILVPV